jgi:hypothetical protein
MGRASQNHRSRASGNQGLVEHFEPPEKWFEPVVPPISPVFAILRVRQDGMRRWRRDYARFVTELLQLRPALKCAGDQSVRIVIE